MVWLLLQGITMTLGLGITTMPTAASTLTAPRSSGWRWILPQGSSQSLRQTWPRAQLLKAPSVSMQSSALVYLCYSAGDEDPAYLVYGPSWPVLSALAFAYV